MPRSLFECFPSRALFLLLVAPTLVRAEGSNTLKTIENPGGGQVVYGPVEGQSSLQGGMGEMLRNIHGHFGNRPQLGQIFQAKGSNSIAAFFTLIARTQGNKPIAGLVIVSMAQGAEPTGAVLYDDAAHFPKTEPVLLNKLNEAWRSAVTATAARPGKAAHEPVALPLRLTPFPDNSGSIGLPAGWRVLASHGGEVMTAGPHGETVNVGISFYPIYDPRNPQVQQRMRYARGMKFLACPYGGDPVSAYLCVGKQNRQNNGLPPATINIVSSQPIPTRPLEAQAAMVMAEIDLHDGNGPMTASLHIGISREAQNGVWTLALDGVMAPKERAEEEWPTLKAIFESYRTNDKVIGAQTQQKIGEIHAIGAAAAKQAAAAHAAEDAQSAAFNTHMDSIDRNSKAFELYTLDETQIQDNENNTRGTVYNGDANRLMRIDPNRFQSVPTQDFLKGVDY
jgi:hypothetical protein